MKILVTILFAVLFVNNAVAQNIILFVENKSAETITISKPDGGKDTLEANTFIEEMFENNSIVSCFIKNKLVCTWRVHEDSEPDSRMIGLGYGNYGTGFACKTFFVPIDD